MSIVEGICLGVEPTVEVCLGVDRQKNDVVMPGSRVFFFWLDTRVISVQQQRPIVIGNTRGLLFVQARLPAVVIWDTHF